MKLRRMRKAPAGKALTQERMVSGCKGQRRATGWPLCTAAQSCTCTKCSSACAKNYAHAQKGDGDRNDEVASTHSIHRRTKAQNGPKVTWM